VRDGKMRADLLYRLQVFPIHMPPLRERGADIELLAEYFLGQLNERHGTSKTWTAAALERLREHPWPGNVRELKNVVHRSFIMADHEITPASLPPTWPAGPRPSSQRSFEIGASLEEVKHWLIHATLGSYGGNKSKAAEILGISPSSL
jgi:DNA-binding NtrC family response regulator